MRVGRQNSIATPKLSRSKAALVLKHALSFLLLIILSSCHNAGRGTMPGSASEPSPNFVPASASKERIKIVSLAPSNTELLLDIGAAGTICGVCSNCPKVLSGRKELDDIPIAGSFTSANLERLKRLAPDVVLLVSGQESLASLLSKNGFKVVLLKNNRLDDIHENLLALGEITGGGEIARERALSFKDSLAKIRSVVAGKRTPVFYCVWPQPLLTVGARSFLDDVITECGGKNIAGHMEQPYPQFTVEKLVIANPDVVILPFEMKGSPSLRRFPWTSLKAAKTGRLHFLPPPEEDFLARPTLRVTPGLVWLAKILHPDKSDRLSGRL